VIPEDHPADVVLLDGRRLSAVFVADVWHNMTWAKWFHPKAEWQPIETAPMDGTIIIAKGFHDYRKTERMIAQAVIYKDSGGWKGWLRDNHGCGFVIQCFPTDWIEMPEDTLKKEKT
jgi:hypothetical protein